MASTARLLVTSALPYANGPIHLGHLVEYLQTDIWVRFQKMMGRRAIYICADDTHGTAIMMRAQREGISETELIERMREEHVRDFSGFGIEFDNYGSTHSDENRELCADIWARLKEQGLVVDREVTQLFDPVTKVFLADRFVKGKCPKCGTAEQYGDNCENCGAAYAATDLVEPRSVYSGAAPEVRSALHYFVRIEGMRPFLDEWTQNGQHLQPEIANYLKGHFLAEALRDWDVSRPAPYFGFEIPDAPGHFFYVWFDAPIGYYASTWQWCKRNGESLDDFIRSKDTEIHHFIGKDITYFHTLFWPAMLQAAGLNTPTRVQVHGFLTVNGEKMSKSRGTFVKAETYLKHLDPAYLRYFYASKLTDKVDDIDLNLEEFQAKVNSDIIGKVVNLASRTARLTPRLSSVYPSDGGLFEAGARAGQEIADAYQKCDFARAMRLIMALSDRANEYVDQKEPWKLKKQPERAEELRDVCTIVLNLYRQIVLYLAPVLPKLRDDSSELLRCPLSDWTSAANVLLDVEIAPFSHLLQRVDPKKVEQIVNESREQEGAAPEAQVASETASKAPEPFAPECTIDDLGKIDLRVAKVIQAEHVPEAKKLLKLTVDLGGSETRTIFAGIKAAYEPETLTGRLIVIVANLAPRKMKFGLSEGMVLCAGEGEKDLFVLSPDSGAQPGQRLR